MSAALHSSIMNSSRLAAAIAVSLGAILLPVHAQDEQAAPPPENSGHSIWTQNVSGFRKLHGSVGLYTKRWDLSDLPHYVPRRQLTGTLRIWGNNYLQDGKLGEYWRDAFRKFEPGLTIEYHLPTGAIAVSAVAAGVADIGMNYKATLTDRLIFEQTFHYPLTEITAVTGSLDVYGWAPAGIIVVRQDNPLDRISIKQLDDVFGGARNGGYVGTVWHMEYPYARGADEDIRRWGQLGLGGGWAEEPIHVYGQNLSAGAMLQFSNEVLGGSLQFVEGYTAFTNYVATDGRLITWSSQVRHAVLRDRYAIAYASPQTLGPGLKELAIQARDGGPYVPRTLDTVRDNTYPLTHHGFFYVNKPPGKPLDPKVEEFIRFALSREGQDCVQREGRYLPLTAAIVQEQLQKLQ